MELIKKYKILNGILLITFIIGCGGASSSVQEKPDWVENYVYGPNYSATTKILEVIGIGESKAEAVSDALVEIDRWMKTKIESSYIMGGMHSRKSMSAGTAKLSIGKVKIFSAVISSDIEYEDQLSTVVTDIKSEVVFDNPPHYLKLQASYDSFESNGVNDESKTFIIHSKNSSLQDLIDELKSNGVGVKLYHASDKYYAKLSLDYSLQDSSKYTEMDSTLNDPEWGEYEKELLDKIEDSRKKWRYQEFLALLNEIQLWTERKELGDQIISKNSVELMYEVRTALVSGFSSLYDKWEKENRHWHWDKLDSLSEMRPREVIETPVQLEPVENDE